ncbi:hypothetical protein QE152_g6108 [Popillia japonica]|uniref:Mutator-like transposase domain-containing protein n=1 Tax=Popillia japonica TaxID=7064 RepID=A0AAW1MGG6_POPJA
MEKAGKEELRLAKEAGDVDERGRGVISVFVDGAWCKRSYKTNYNASSGVAAIIGQRTKRVLFVGVKNKYCCLCDRNTNVNKTHVCYKNWTKSSAAMESAIIIEGFKKSIEMHSLIYGRIIGDGDSSVIINRIKDISKKPKLDKDIKHILTNNQLRFRTAITKAIAYRSRESKST